MAKFQPLQPEQLRQIAARLLEQSTQRAKRLGLQVEVDERAIQTLVQAGCRDGGGARGLRRAVRTRVEEPLADRLICGAGQTVRLCGMEQQIELVEQPR